MIKQGRLFLEAPHCSGRKKRWPAGPTPLRGNRNSEDKKDDTGPKPSRFKSRGHRFSRKRRQGYKGTLLLSPKGAIDLLSGSHSFRKIHAKARSSSMYVGIYFESEINSLKISGATAPSKKSSKKGA